MRHPGWQDWERRRRRREVGLEVLAWTIVLVGLTIGAFGVIGFVGFIVAAFG